MGNIYSSGKTNKTRKSWPLKALQTRLWKQGRLISTSAVTACFPSALASLTVWNTNDHTEANHTWLVYITTQHVGHTCPWASQPLTSIHTPGPHYHQHLLITTYTHMHNIYNVQMSALYVGLRKSWLPYVWLLQWLMKSVSAVWIWAVKGNGCSRHKWKFIVIVIVPQTVNCPCRTSLSQVICNSFAQTTWCAVNLRLNSP